MEGDIYVCRECEWDEKCWYISEGKDERIREHCCLHCKKNERTHPAKWQRITTDTEYLESIPGMVDSIVEGMNTDIKDCED